MKGPFVLRDINLLAHANNCLCSSPEVEPYSISEQGSVHHQDEHQGRQHGSPLPQIEPVLGATTCVGTLVVYEKLVVAAYAGMGVVKEFYWLFCILCIYIFRYIEL